MAANFGLSVILGRGCCDNTENNLFDNVLLCP